MCSVIGQQCGRRLASSGRSAVREASSPVSLSGPSDGAGWTSSLEEEGCGAGGWGAKRKRKKCRKGRGEKEAAKTGRLKLVVPGREGGRAHWASPTFRFTFSPMLGGGRGGGGVQKKVTSRVAPQLGLWRG